MPIRGMESIFSVSFRLQASFVSKHLGVCWIEYPFPYIFLDRTILAATTPGSIRVATIRTDKS